MAKPVRREVIEPWPSDWNSWSVKQKDIYIGKEKERWSTGWAGLTGRHYFYATQGSIKTIDNRIIRPRIRDTDIFVNQEFERAKGLQYDLAIGKRRGYALTSMFGAGYSMYEAMTSPNSISVLTSADQGRLDDMYTNKLRVFHQHMRSRLKEPLMRRSQGKSLHFGVMDGDDVTGLNSQIVCLETSDGPGAPSKIEAFRATYFFLDESFLHRYADKCVGVAQATVGGEGRKMNPIVIGGSCGIAAIHGLKYMRSIFMEADELEFVTVFVPAYMCLDLAYEIDDKGRATGKPQSFMYEKNGVWISDQKAARKWIETRRAKLFQAKNKTKYNQFCKAYPLYENEMFDLSAESIFKEDVEAKLIEAGVKILNEAYPWVPYRLTEVDDKVVAEPDPSGNVLIHKLPHDSLEYGNGVDPVSWNDGEQETMKGSDTVSIIAPFSDPVPHAVLVEKSSDPDYVSDSIQKLARLYRTKACIERNVGGVLISKLKAAGFTHLIQPQPVFFGPAYFDQKHRLGYYYGTGTIDKIENLVVDWILKHGVNNTLLALNDELKVYGKINTDHVSALKGFLVQAADRNFLLKRDHGVEEYQQTTIVEMGPGGERVERVVSVRVTDEDRMRMEMKKLQPGYYDRNSFF